MKNLSSRKFNHPGIILLLFLVCSAFSAARAQESEATITVRITALTAKINAAPKDDSLYDQRGMAYFTLGKTAEALADANTAIGINPKNTNALFLRGQIRGGKTDYDGAIADYTQTINAYPNAAFRAYMKRGEMYEKKSDKEKARTDYAKALEISSPKSTEAAESLARVGGAANKVNPASSTKTGEFSQSDVDQFNKENPNFAGGNVVTSPNRLNFYTGIGFSNTYWKAVFIAETLNKDVDENIYGSAFLNLLEKSQPLETILKGRPEEKDLTGAIKKLQTLKDWKDLPRNLSSIEAKYKASLTGEQKWYFEVGYSIAQVREGIKDKESLNFVEPRFDLEKYVKSTPKGTPPILLTSLKQTLEILKNTGFGINSTASDYAVLETQVKSVYRSIGQLKIEDINGGK